jgi:hypothetical protein
MTPQQQPIDLPRSVPRVSASSVQEEEEGASFARWLLENHTTTHTQRGPKKAKASSQVCLHWLHTHSWRGGPSFLLSRQSGHRSKRLAGCPFRSLDCDRAITQHTPPPSQKPTHSSIPLAAVHTSIHTYTHRTVYPRLAGFWTATKPTRPDRPTVCGARLPTRRARQRRQQSKASTHTHTRAQAQQSTAAMRIIPSLAAPAALLLLVLVAAGVVGARCVCVYREGRGL